MMKVYGCSLNTTLKTERTVVCPFKNCSVLVRSTFMWENEDNNASFS